VRISHTISNWRSSVPVSASQVPRFPDERSCPSNGSESPVPLTHFANLRWALRYTLGFALVCGALAAIPWLFGGAAVFDRDFTLWQLLLSYLALALVSGVVLGVLRPVASSYPCALALGNVIGWLIAGEVRVFVLGLSPPQFFDALLLGFLGIAGGITGIFWRHGVIGLDLRAKLEQRRGGQDDERE
jgi:hypothetical protein